MSAFEDELEALIRNWYKEEGNEEIVRILKLWTVDVEKNYLNWEIGTTYAQTEV